ncbi:MAG: M15 family metallopeptidase [Flavobacteriaceae bacterium]
MKSIVVSIAIILFTFGCTKLPESFVYLNNIDASIKTELRYLSTNNFIGKPIDGYKREVIIVTMPTAKALAKVQKELLKEELSLKIYDAYRPQQAVDHFVRWAKVLNDTLMKSQYYPNVAKKDLFTLGYIASKSGHTRGSTVDLTIIDSKTGKELDMGSPYDFFGKESHPFYKEINATQKKNRLYLRGLMLKNGFKPYENEWWHFTLKEEPFPKKYFNFPIE